MTKGYSLSLIKCLDAVANFQKCKGWRIILNQSKCIASKVQTMENTLGQIVDYVKNKL